MEGRTPHFSGTPLRGYPSSLNTEDNVSETIRHIQEAIRRLEKDLADELTRQPAAPPPTPAADNAHPAAMNEQSQFLSPPLGDFAVTDETPRRTATATTTSMPPAKSALGDDVAALVQASHANQAMMGQMTAMMAQFFERQNDLAVRGQPFKASIGSTYAGLDEEDPLRFLDQVEKYFQLNNIRDECERIHVIRGQLRGRAHRWAEASRYIPLSYQNFINRFLDKFDSAAGKVPALMRFYGERQKEGEPVEEFICTKQALQHRLGLQLDEETLVDLVTNLMLPAFGSRLRGTNARDLDTLIKYSCQVESSLRLEQQNNATSSIPRTTTRAPTADTSNNQPRGGNAPNKGPPTPCRYCQGWHYNKDCPTLPGNASRAGAAPANPNTSSTTATTTPWTTTTPSTEPANRQPAPKTTRQQT